MEKIVKIRDIGNLDNKKRIEFAEFYKSRFWMFFEITREQSNNDHW